MVDLFDRYGVSTGGSAKPDLFDRYAVESEPVAPRAPSVLGSTVMVDGRPMSVATTLQPPRPEPSAGGVQDWEPRQPEAPGMVDYVNRGINWLGTRATKAGTALLGTPRAFADVQRGVYNALGVPGMPVADPVGVVTQFLPSTHGMNDTVFNKLGVPEVNTPGAGGKILDAATEATLGALVMPGSLARNLIPSAVGGATQEIAGQLTERTKFEPAARVLGGVAGGLGAAALQNAVGNVAQGAKNLRPNVDTTAAKVVGRAIERDRMTGNALAQSRDDLGPGAMIVEAGGPNVRGTMRGAIAAPGPARTAAQDAFDARLEGSNARTTAALDSAISPNNSLATTVDDLAAARAEAARPAYEAAGIPRRPESRITAINEPPTWNTRIVDSPELQTLLRDSPDLRRAVNTLRRFPDYKNVPANSMSMWDEAYKMLGGMEREAVRAGNDRKAMLIGDLRRDFQNALVDANPEYGRALKAYAGPSKLIDAAEKGREWFTKNTDPKVAAKEWQAMSADEQQAALVGVRDWARTTIGRSDRGGAAERVWNGGDNRERLKAVLGPEGFDQLAKTINTERNVFKTSRDINVGSRTAPMALEAGDNAMQIDMAKDIIQGNFGGAIKNFIGGAYNRLAEGRTEAVNARIAEMLTSSDPEQLATILRALDEARIADLARSSGRWNALTYGGAVAPTVNALAGERR